MALVARCYAAEHRYADLARVESMRVGLATQPVEQARALARLARVHLEHLGQLSRAQDELDRAVRLSPDDPEVGGLLGRVCAATGERDRAIRALLRAHPAARDIEIAGAGLEEAFLEITGQDDPEMEEAA